MVIFFFLSSDEPPRSDKVGFGPGFEPELIFGQITSADREAASPQLGMDAIKFRRSFSGSRLRRRLYLA